MAHLARRLLRWTGFALALVLLAAAGLVAWDRWQQPPEPDPAALLARAASYHARIQRDAYGVPHISGARDIDVAYGLAYAHAEDDFATIQDVLRATRGTLAAIKGPKAAPTDYLVQFFGVWDAIRARYETDLPPEVRAVLQAYADGINHYAALHPGEVEPGTLPVTGQDIAAGFAFKSPFFFGMEDQLKRLTAPAAAAAATEVPPKGSNGVAVAPSRSSDGATRLLVNSHQPYVGPVAWYEAVLESGEGWHVAGGFFPGSPFMLHGHNEHLGWAHTVNKPASLITVYKLTLKPDDPDQYLLDGQWRHFETRDVALRVKLLGPLMWTVHRPLLHSVHGPVLKTDTGTYALRWAGMGEINQALQYFRENKARDIKEWRAALALNAVPSLNYLYADEKGHIGFVYNGRYPDLPPNLDVSHDLPGDRSDLIWTRYRPISQIPQIWDPASGFVFNCNNTPLQATGPQDQLHAADFPASMGLETQMNNRALRVEETYGADTAISADTFRHYKYDLRYSEHSEVVALVTELLALKAPDLAPAQTILKHWNRSADRRNREAPLVLLTAYKVLAYHGPRLMAPEAGLREAMASLQENFGRLDPTWGQVNRIRRGTVNLPIDGARDTFRSVWGEPDSDGRLKAVAGDTLIMFIQWDREGHLSSRSIHQFGSATLDEQSRHYADQTPMFSAMQTKPVWFTQAQLAGHVEEDYAPGQRKQPTADAP